MSSKGWREQGGNKGGHLRGCIQIPILPINLVIGYNCTLLLFTPVLLDALGIPSILLTKQNDLFLKLVVLSLPFFSPFVKSLKLLANLELIKGCGLDMLLTHMMQQHTQSTEVVPLNQDRYPQGNMSFHNLRYN